MAETTIVNHINAVYPSSADKLKAELPYYAKIVEAYPKVGSQIMSRWKGHDVAFLLDTLFPQYAGAEEVSQIEQFLVEQEFLDRDYLDEGTVMSEMQFAEIENMLSASNVPIFDRNKFIICLRYLFGILLDVAMTG